MTSRLPPVPTRPRAPFRAPFVGAVALLLALPALSCASVQAQMGTVSLQAARLDGVATTASIGVGWAIPLGDAGGLPAPGEERSSEVSSWLVGFGVGLGASVAGDRGDKDAFTANGHAGLLWRTGSMVDQVGVVAAIGPALTAKVAILELRAGGLWMEHDLGLRWFAGMGISLQFLLDVFAR
jgi:hypothetical protein